MATSGDTNNNNITTNYQLEKPNINDNYDINVFNNNMDKLDKINLPIGSLIYNKYEINPSDYYYGTWERVEDTFILAAGSIYTAGDTGGEATHKLTIDEMPSHKHDLKAPTGNLAASGGGIGNEFVVSDTQGRSLPKWTVAAGGSQAHNNMPPYKVYYCWERIS